MLMIESVTAAAMAYGLEFYPRGDAFRVEPSDNRDAGSDCTTLESAFAEICERGERKGRVLDDSFYDGRHAAEFVLELESYLASFPDEGTPEFESLANAYRRACQASGHEELRDHALAAKGIRQLIERESLELHSTFIPYSQSRNAKPRNGADKAWESLNWEVTLKRKGRHVCVTQYSAGMAHAPAYKAAGKKGAPRADSIDGHKRIMQELETGRAAPRFGDTSTKPGAPIKPEFVDVLGSLASDSDVLNYSGFEDWASCMGYNTDSRSAESMYQACLAIALALRNGLGESLMQTLAQFARRL